MIRFLSGFTFLYCFTILLLIAYGVVFYRAHASGKVMRGGFHWLFASVSIVCLGFLGLNFNAPLSLETVSNADHHFIRLDGLLANGSIQLGGTTNTSGDGFINEFYFSREGNKVHVRSTNADEPFYVKSGSTYKLLSNAYPAKDKSLSFWVDSTEFRLTAASEKSLVLFANSVKLAEAQVDIRRGISLEKIFREDGNFMNSPWYGNEGLQQSLSSIMLLRDDLSAKSFGALQIFLCASVFKQVNQVYYDGHRLSKTAVHFDVKIDDGTIFTWGIGFLDNNRNQFQIRFEDNNSFLVLNRFPKIYPLAEKAENRQSDQYTTHRFLVSDRRDLISLPSMFRQGFMFSEFSQDSLAGFAPVLLSYDLNSAGSPIQYSIGNINRNFGPATTAGKAFRLTGRSGKIQWIFSIVDTYSWRLGGYQISSTWWQSIIFGSLLIFILLVFGWSVARRKQQQSWVWQIFAVVTLVMLTTRFFLYWRYKSFPPYDSLDLPSIQQLNSFGNFAVIVFTTILLAIIFGWGWIKMLYQKSRGLVRRIFKLRYNRQMPTSAAIFISELEGKAANSISTSRLIYFGSWSFFLCAAGVYSTLRSDVTLNRHIAIGLILLYFGYLFISYRFSPLVAQGNRSWWSLNTSRKLELLFSNPVKILLSVSLLGLFALVDIGVAIIFINFLIFNEAFLCINYSAAGLSAGNRRNAFLFGVAGAIYLGVFLLNLAFGPLIFRTLISLPQLLYLSGYVLFALLMAYSIIRLLGRIAINRRLLIFLGLAMVLFSFTFIFFPRNKVLDKAASTRYRIDVMTTNTADVIQTAYLDGKTYEPVIRAAQNQWFINSFIYEKNNPNINQAAFHLMPHAPQSKGAKYNAQATDLVASRFFLAEHGRWALILFVLLLIIPGSLLAAFYKLYPDFTNRLNQSYPSTTIGFSILNYFLVTALLVVMAATGRYIFFGQDLPFGSILSKQSILFPAILIVLIVMLFSRLNPEQYPSRRKLIPGLLVFTGLAAMLFFIKPAFNKGREFNVTDLAGRMDLTLQEHVQPLYTFIDTARLYRHLNIKEKDRIFSDSLRSILANEISFGNDKFLHQELVRYSQTSYLAHISQKRILYLDLHKGRPELAINDNYFRVEPPPHLQQSWTGNVYGDSSRFIMEVWERNAGMLWASNNNEPKVFESEGWSIQSVVKDNSFLPVLINKSGSDIPIVRDGHKIKLRSADTIYINNPANISVMGKAKEWLIVSEPPVFMKNLMVNGSRYYVYPRENDFIWARNFAEGISSSFSGSANYKRNAFISVEAELQDSLQALIRTTLGTDTSYKNGVEYAINVADGSGRIRVFTDYIKGSNRPDPNDKTAFARIVNGEGEFVSQARLRKQIGNLNLLRMNPGPGSTLKPIVFAAVASQLELKWEALQVEGFEGKLEKFGGETVGKYDFEKNNGRISTITDYLKYSDNYYHSIVMLIGSYTAGTRFLQEQFQGSPKESGVSWPWFRYREKSYWLNSFSQWPGFSNGRANFGSDSSYLSAGLNSNFSITTSRKLPESGSAIASSFFVLPVKSGFAIPEEGLFDQSGTGMDMRKPKEVFISSFRGHVKGSSQVMLSPLTMTAAFGKLVSQNRNYSLTLNPYGPEPAVEPFKLGSGVKPSDYMLLIRDGVIKGLKEVLINGTAVRLGSMLKGKSPYFYYAKTGTTGDDASNSKSKLFALVISKKDMSKSDYSFRNNKFYIIYFTSQNGPAKQNEELQLKIIQAVEGSSMFVKYMNSGNQ